MLLCSDSKVIPEKWFWIVRVFGSQAASWHGGRSWGPAVLPCPVASQNLPSSCSERSVSYVSTRRGLLGSPPTHSLVKTSWLKVESGQKSTSKQIKEGHGGRSRMTRLERRLLGSLSSRTRALLGPQSSPLLIGWHTVRSQATCVQIISPPLVSSGTFAYLGFSAYRIVGTQYLIKLLYGFNEAT